ncbi:MAG TPA: rhombotarget lipoprotein [Steroidobacteraceae bacterium]
MRIHRVLGVIVLATSVSGCDLLHSVACEPRCHSSTRNSSSVVDFLYSDSSESGGPPPQNVVPELHLPLRVGLAFLPPRNGRFALDASQQEQLLERIRQNFRDRRFISEIVIIPDYYLANRRGFEGLQGVRRLYGVDLMAIVSYDQAIHEDNNQWSLGYLTIVGAYVLKGDRHDISTLVDLAVVDPVSHSLVLRAGGVDVRHGNSTMIDADRSTREAGAQGFSAATDQMIDHFDIALTRFETDVRGGHANVRVVHKSSEAGQSHGGGGALNWTYVTLLALLVLARGTRLPRTVLTGRDEQSDSAAI